MSPTGPRQYLGIYKDPKIGPDSCSPQIVRVEFSLREENRSIEILIPIRGTDFPQQRFLPGERKRRNTSHSRKGWQWLGLLFRHFGARPTRLILPANMLNIWGSSSSFDLRKSAPSHVIRLADANG